MMLLFSTMMTSNPEIRYFLVCFSTLLFADRPIPFEARHPLSLSKSSIIFASVCIFAAAAVWPLCFCLLSENISSRQHLLLLPNAKTLQPYPKIRHSGFLIYSSRSLNIPFPPINCLVLLLLLSMPYSRPIILFFLSVVFYLYLVSLSYCLCDVILFILVIFLSRLQSLSDRGSSSRQASRPSSLGSSISDIRDDHQASSVGGTGGTQPSTPITAHPVAAAAAALASGAMTPNGDIDYKKVNDTNDVVVFVDDSPPLLLPFGVVTRIRREEGRV